MSLQHVLSLPDSDRCQYWNGQLIDPVPLSLNNIILITSSADLEANILNDETAVPHCFYHTGIIPTQPS